MDLSDSDLEEMDHGGRPAPITEPNLGPANESVAKCPVPRPRLTIKEPTCPGEVIPGVRARDAMPLEDTTPITALELDDPISGKFLRKSLMRPQDLAARILPREEFERLAIFATEGCPTECGPPWAPEVIEAAKRAGPHTSANTPENVELIWDDISYQRDAGFIRIVPEARLFGPNTPRELKISRVAVVPQTNRRGRIILNLSAEVDLGVERATGRRRWKKRIHPSVNETTEAAAAAEQIAVKALGTALQSLLFYMFDTCSYWEIDWHKIDLSDGFWRMIVEAGKEYNFVFQLPMRDTDSERHYVVPSSLQMGWKNSPAFFCTGTEATRRMIRRLLAMTSTSGISTYHQHESYLTKGSPLPNFDPVPGPVPWPGLRDAEFMCRVFVDDFMGGLAGDPARKSRLLQQLWVSRASLHCIHAIFPPPNVLSHVGGKDSISLKKLKKGDAWFKQEEILLGFLMSGRAGHHRTVAVPSDKHDKYVGRLRKALEQRSHWISFSEFQKIHGQLQHVSVAVPCLRGLMTPLNEVLSRAPQTVGLKKGSTLRSHFEVFATLLEDAQTHPSHIAEIVGPNLPHYYGMTDASGVGAGGVWLPCTEWIHPVVWRLEWPSDIQSAIRDGSVSMVDCEFAAYFIAECMVDGLSERAAPGLSTFLWTDNSPTKAIVQRQASRARSPMPGATLRWLALRQRWTRRGPQDIEHWEGKTNLMADFASRSFEEGYPDREDDAFFAEFDTRFPLPPQLRYWTFARPRREISSAAISLLRKHVNPSTLATTALGSFGVGLPIPLAATLSSPEYRETNGPTSWNENTCSFPLLLPCGTGSSTVANSLQARRSRATFSKSPKSWRHTDLEILAGRILDKPN